MFTWVFVMFIWTLGSMITIFGKTQNHLVTWAFSAAGVQNKPFILVLSPYIQF